MILWLLGLPFAFVVSLGYYSIIVCTVVGYGALQYFVHELLLIPYMEDAHRLSLRKLEH